jgi:hypothetical protein
MMSWHTFSYKREESSLTTSTPDASTELEPEQEAKLVLLQV